MLDLVANAGRTEFSGSAEWIDVAESAGRIDIAENAGKTEATEGAGWIDIAVNEGRSKLQSSSRKG